MRPTAAFILCLDPGWLFVLAGLAICTSAVLIPARQSLHELRQSLTKLQAEEAHAAARLKAYSEFLDDLEQDDPQLVRRLAASQLNLVPAGDEPVLLTTSHFATLTDWIDCTVPVREVRTTAWPDSLLTRLTGGPHRRWLIAGGGFCVFIGLLLAPSEPRRRAGRSRKSEHAWRVHRDVCDSIPLVMSRLGIRRAADGTGWEDALADLPPCRVDDRIEVIIESDEREAEPEEVVENAADVADGAGEVEFEVGKAAEIDDEPSDPPARLRAVDDGVNEPAHSHPAAERTLFDDLQDYGEDAAEDSPAITTAWDEPREPSVPSEPTDESPPEPQSSVAVEAECSLSQALPAPERDAPALEVMLETDSPEAGSEPITEPEPEAEAQTAAEPLSREVSPVEGSSEDTDESAESGTEAEIEGTELKPSKADVETEADDEEDEQSEDAEDDMEEDEEDDEEWEYVYEYVEVDDEEEDEEGAVEDGEDDEYEYVYEYEYVDEEPDGDDDVEVIRVPEDED